MSTATPIMGAWDIEGVAPKGDGYQRNPTPEKDASLEVALDEARELVSENVDAEEPTILRSAFERAEGFLRTHSREMKKRFSHFPPTPSITPGPKGSADVNWVEPTWALLVNVPAGEAFATFYGDAQGSGRIKGSLDPKIWNLGIITWLSKS